MRNLREQRPELVRSVEIEAFVQVELDPEPRLVDLEESTEPHDEEQDQSRIAVGEVDLVAGLASLAGVQRKPEDEELPLGQLADSLDALLACTLDLGELADVEAARFPRSDVSSSARVRARIRRPGPRGTRWTSKRRARWRCPAASTTGRVAPAPASCSLTLPPYPMPSSMTRGCRGRLLRLEELAQALANAGGGAAWRASWPRSGGSAHG